MPQLFGFSEQLKSNGDNKEVVDHSPDMAPAPRKNKHETAF